MRKIMFLAICVSFVLNAMAQSKSKMDRYKQKKKQMDMRWCLHHTLQNPHIYSTQAEGGPLTTNFKFTKKPLLTFDGGIEGSGKKLKGEIMISFFDTKSKIRR